MLRDSVGEDVRITCVIPYPGGSGDLLLAGTLGGNILLIRTGRQGERRWHHVITTPGLSTELSTLAEVVVDEEGNIAGVGSLFNAGNDQRLYLFRYHPLSRELLYFRQAPWSSEGTGLKLGSPGEYLISGSRNGEPQPVFNAAFLARVDRATGTFTDTGTTFDFRGDESLLDLYRLPDGTAFCGGTVSGSGAGAIRASITRLSADGSHQWTRMGYAPVGSNARLFTFDVEVIGSTVYVLSWGNVGVITGSINTAMILSAFTLDGEHRWTRRYDVTAFNGEEAIELVPHQGGLLAYGFTLIGERVPFLIHLGPEGSVRWARTYGLPGSVLLYFRCNQQLYADEAGIVALGSYSGPGRPREGIVLNLDTEGLTANLCLPVENVAVNVTDLYTDWAEVTLEPTPQSAPWQPVAAAPEARKLMTYDDCDLPCDDCAERTFRRRAVCAGEAVVIGGLERTETGVYSDTIAGTLPECDSIVLTELVVSNGPVVTVSVDRSCGFATADVQLSTSAGEPPYSFTWSVPTAEGARASLPTGNYQVTVTDALGCNPAVVDVVVDVVVDEAPTGTPDFRFGPPFCPGDSTGFIRLQTAGAGSLRLLPGGAFQADEITGLPPGTYGIVLRSETGCEAFRQVTIPPARPAAVRINAPRLVRLGDEVSLTASSGFGSLFSEYRWSADDSLRCTTCPEAVLRATQSGPVRLDALTTRGCPVRDSVFLTVLTGAPRLYFPTGFSPNGDNLNDRWVPGLGPEVERVLTMEVYDRWGGLVWQYAGGENWWDGADSPTGVYTFSAEVELIDGRRARQRGEVTLIR